MQSCRWLHPICIPVIIVILMGQTSHQEELVLLLKLTKDMYVIFYISNMAPYKSKRVLLSMYKLCAYDIFWNRVFSPQVIDLKTQLNYFKNLVSLFRKKLGHAEVKTFFGRAVYLISIGGNDYLVPFNSNSSVLQSISKEEYVDMVIGNLTTVIKVTKISTIHQNYYTILFSFPLSSMFITVCWCAS